MKTTHQFVTLGTRFLLTTLFCWSPSPLHAQQVKAQYVRIELPGTERTLSLAEIKVYSGQANIAPTGKTTQASTFSDALASRAIDSNSGGEFFGRSVTSTSTQTNPWWELDLGSEQAITTISVFNRTDCCKDRINPARILVLNKQKEVVWEGVITTTEVQYEFKLNQSSMGKGSVSPNLLRNSNFRQLTNPPLPDYWDLHHIAALTMPNLHEQYGIDENMQSPVSETKVLRIHNSEVGFSHLNLMPRRFFSDLPDGQYTFSVYLKSSDNGMGYKVSRAWGQGEPATHKLTTSWERYPTTFRISKTNSDTLQPILFFPSKGTYYVAAPQLERGDKPNVFQLSIDDAIPEIPAIPIRQQLKVLLESLSGAVLPAKRPLLSAQFDYDYYTTQNSARLILTSRYEKEMAVSVKCTNGTGDLLPLSVPSDIVLRPSLIAEIVVSLSTIPHGRHTCQVEPLQSAIRRAATTAKLNKLLPNQVEVRVNSQRRFITINEKPFFMIGMGVGGWKTPPDWYFADIAAHGINTVFYTRQPNAHGEYDDRSVEEFVAGAGRNGLKAIIGIPLAGAKVSNWRQRLAGFLRLISKFKNNSTVIGWYAVDEPAAHTWQDNEILELYHEVKAIDPYRLIFINWAYDGVPMEIGQEPRGTLAASDVYSSDYYPFSGQRHEMNGYVANALRTLETARIHGKVAHSWVQIYGGMDAWREPTGDELNFMAYLNLIYGGYISYWDTRSNSRETWARLAAINQEAKFLSEELFLNTQARELYPPSLKANFVYTVWQRGRSTLMIVAHNGNETESFSFESATVLGLHTLHAKSLFGGAGVSVVNHQIQDVFRPFECKVYVLDGE